MEELEEADYKSVEKLNAMVGDEGNCNQQLQNMYNDIMSTTTYEKEVEMYAIGENPCRVVHPILTSSSWSCPKDRWLYHTPVAGITCMFQPYHIPWIKRNGKAPVRWLQASHRCHNGNCVEPTHLRWETAKANESREKCRNCSHLVLQNGDVHVICPHNPPCLRVKVLGHGTIQKFITKDSANRAGLVDLRRDNNNKKVTNLVPILNDVFHNDKPKFRRKVKYLRTRLDTVDNGKSLVGLKPCKVCNIVSNNDRGGSRTKWKIGDKQRRFTCTHIFWVEGKNSEAPEGLDISHRCHEQNCCEPSHYDWESDVFNKGRNGCASGAIIIDPDGNKHLICPHKKPCITVRRLGPNTYNERLSTRLKRLSSLPLLQYFIRQTT